MTIAREAQTILVVDDNDEDRHSTVRAIRKAGLANNVELCESGGMALDYLYRQNGFADPACSPRPGMILLDLEMPGLDGRDVLTRVKDDEALKTIPVIVLTSSIAASDIEKCYACGANSYLQKPISFPGLVESIQKLADYWFEIVVLPKENFA